MRILLMSDLHLEGHKDQGVSFVSSIQGEDVDVLVLAGDILYLKHNYWPKKHFETLCSRFKDVVYIPGNHEYYNASITKAGETIRTLEQSFANLHVLKSGQPKTIQGRRFLGDTLWFPDRPDNILYSDGMNDFHIIQGFVPWVYADHENTVRGLENHLQQGDIVVTHHLPSELSIHPKYKGDGLNRFFCYDLTNLILDRKPALWMHGHTHEKFDYTLGETRIVCNPLGYLRERLDTPFNEKKYIDL